MTRKKSGARRKPTLRDAQKADTRRRLLESARNVFFREGYYGGTIDQIVAEAGASRPTFYLHFRDKEHVLSELMAEYVVRSKPYIERFPEHPVTIARLTDWLRELAQFIDKEAALFSIQGEVSTHRPPNSDESVYFTSTINQWIKLLGQRSAAFAAAARGSDVEARARAELLVIDLVWAAGNVARNKASAFTEKTVQVVARSLFEFVSDTRFGAKGARRRQV